MTIIKTAKFERLIPTEYFDICKIDGKTRAEIGKLYKRTDVTTHKSCYFLEKFKFHIKKIANLDLKEYCKTYLNTAWPVCPINGKEVGFTICGAGVVIPQFNAVVTREFSPKFDEACNRMSRERIGKGNPMYGKIPWNNGLTAETNEVVKRVADGRIGKDFLTPEGREKNRQRLLGKPGLHCKPHSPETIEKLRKNTARLWATGVFNRITSIHLKMREFLNTLPLVEAFREEYQMVYFSLDFAFPDAKIAIETDGTFYHVDPRVYPNGPINAIQRRNFGRDKAKNKFADRLEWKIIRVWETEINDGTFKEYILCKLKELNLLKV